MNINKIEYLILSSAFTNFVNLKNVAIEHQISYAEIAMVANRLFANGEIVAELSIQNEEYIRDIALTIDQIKAHLDGKLHFYYYLTSKGGEKWEKFSSPKWNLFFRDRYFYQEQEAEIICAERKLLEKLFLRAGYSGDFIPIPETAVWDIVEPWQATYWKILPSACRVRYKCKTQTFESNLDTTNFEELTGVDEQEQMHSDSESLESLEWYTEPELDSDPSSWFDDKVFSYFSIIPQNPNPKIEYLILEMAVIVDRYQLGDIAYSERLSHNEVAIAANSLFEKGLIRAKVFPDKYMLEEGISEVILTMTGIEDNLNGILNASYYLTPKGGAYWESLANPNWDKFFLVNFKDDFSNEEGIIATQRQTIENLLYLDRFVIRYQHISGTEVWNVLEPWQATYWKSLPRGYHVSYQYKCSDFFASENIPSELKKTAEQASQWYEKMRKWYTEPEFLSM